MSEDAAGPGRDEIAAAILARWRADDTARSMPGYALSAADALIDAALFDRAPAKAAEDADLVAAYLEWKRVSGESDDDPTAITRREEAHWRFDQAASRVAALAAPPAPTTTDAAEGKASLSSGGLRRRSALSGRFLTDDPAEAACEACGDVPGYCSECGGGQTPGAQTPTPPRAASPHPAAGEA